MTYQQETDWSAMEKKWQNLWEELGLHRAEDFSDKQKEYLLIEFPYPSGEGLHVGHVKTFTSSDIMARKKRMEGINVLFPIGWDAFGLPTENYAIKTGIHPTEVTKNNIKVFTKQLKTLGLSFDWSREINTSDPAYYKWTQWIFLQLFKAGLAYQAKIPINWCPSCKIGLANEEVVGGKCERCGAKTKRKIIKQWMLKITAYADKLIEGLKEVDFLEEVVSQQINWIGRSEGTNIKFKIKDQESEIEVFTTRIDTIFGVTGLVIAPEHQLLTQLQDKITNWPEVKKYIDQARQKSEMERTQLAKEKTGVEVKGVKLINPVNEREIALWVGDYVIATYGGGAVMMVPAHDQRDFDFAREHGLKIIEVIEPVSDPGAERNQQGKMLEAYQGEGKLINSEQFSGLPSDQARPKITAWLEKKGWGGPAVNYKLRDWVFSRQHYWGEPIPIIHCPKCGAVAIPEGELPLELPHVEKYEPTETGESPLASVTEWVETVCPQCGGPARRETDTMPNWAGSSWYYIRYTDPHNDQTLAETKKMKYWLPVNLYNGGPEHITLHLFYSRFWHKFLYDRGVVPCPEPYAARRTHGMVLGEGGEKMSKSRGNVVNPDDIIKRYNADTLRLYEMFMGPFDQDTPWDPEAVEGIYRFLNRVIKLQERIKKNISSNLERIKHQTIKKVSEDIDQMKFNTAVAALMSFVNDLYKEKEVNKKDYQTLIKLLAPFAPHTAEEIWHRIENAEGKSIFQEPWPKFDPRLATAEEIELIIQINGKVRDKITADPAISEEEAKEKAQQQEKIKKYLAGKKITKIIFVPGKLINFVVH